LPKLTENRPERISFSRKKAQRHCKRQGASLRARRDFFIRELRELTRTTQDRLPAGLRQSNDRHTSSLNWLTDTIFVRPSLRASVKSRSPVMRKSTSAARRKPETWHL